MCRRAVGVSMTGAFRRTRTGQYGNSMVRRAGRRPRAVSLGPLGQFTFCGHRPLQGAHGNTDSAIIGGAVWGWMPQGGLYGGAHRRRGQAPALRGWNVSACPVVFRRVPAAGHTGPALRTIWAARTCFVGDDAHIVPVVRGNDGQCISANLYRAVRKFDGAVCGPTPQGGFSWPVGPIHLL